MGPGRRGLPEDSGAPLVTQWERSCSRSVRLSPVLWTAPVCGPGLAPGPQDSPAAKLAATRAYQDGQPGSEVVLFDRYKEDRQAIGQRLAQVRGMTLIPPYDHAHVMAGQGTAAAELIEEVGPLDLLLVCLGGGGLLSGCAVAALGRRIPECNLADRPRLLGASERMAGVVDPQAVA